MPKLDDYDDSHATNPVSDSAKASITNKVTSGASVLVTAPATSGAFANSASTSSGFGGTAGGFGSGATTPATGFSGGSPAFGQPAAGGFGSSSSGFGSTPLGGNTASSFGGGGFGSTPGATGMGGMPNSQSASLQSTGGAMQEGGTAEIAVDSGFSDFINKRWRPLMAVIYMVTCTTDFVIFPILWSMMQALYHGTVTSQWQPLTLQGAGLYHIAMGAVLGLAAYGRSQEKIAGKA